MRNLLKTTLCALLLAALTVPAWAMTAPCTGDRMNMPLMIGLIAAAVVAIVVLVIIMTRSNKK